MKMAIHRDDIRVGFEFIFAPNQDDDDHNVYTILEVDEVGDDHATCRISWVGPYSGAQSRNQMRCKLYYEWYNPVIKIVDLDDGDDDECI
jgi:hypothetical protein